MKWRQATIQKKKEKTIQNNHGEDDPGSWK